jgi:hypothetical protein
MKKILLLFIIIFSACTNSDEKLNGYNVDVVFVNNVFQIDQEFIVSIISNEPIKEIWSSFDNFATGGYTNYFSINNNTLRYSFDTLGEKNIALRIKNQKGEIAEKHISVNVVRGNSIKITGLQVLSFYGINTSFDPEYTNSNPESLADLKFGFSKYMIGFPFQIPNVNQYSWKNWYSSSVILNQGNMTWDLHNSNLYINPNSTVRFGLVDIDENNIAGADLLNGPPDYRELSFQDYISSKPSTITYNFPEINLSLVVSINWPN